MSECCVLFHILFSVQLSWYTRCRTTHQFPDLTDILLLKSVMNFISWMLSICHMTCHHHRFVSFFSGEQRRGMLWNILRYKQPPAENPTIRRLNNIISFTKPFSWFFFSFSFLSLPAILLYCHVEKLNETIIIQLRAFVL